MENNSLIVTFWNASKMNTDYIWPTLFRQSKLGQLTAYNAAKRDL